MKTYISRESELTGGFFIIMVAIPVDASRVMSTSESWAEETEKALHFLFDNTRARVLQVLDSMACIVCHDRRQTLLCAYF